MEAAVTNTIRFSSKKDKWLVSVLKITIAVELVAALIMAAVGPPSAWYRAVVPLVLLVSAIVVAWSLIGTSYRVSGGDLEIRQGPFRRRVRIAEIVSVRRIDSILAAPALSSDRLELRRAKRNWPVHVSPADPAAFVGALHRANLNISVEGEGPTLA